LFKVTHGLINEPRRAPGPAVPILDVRRIEPSIGY